MDKTSQNNLPEQPYPLLGRENLLSVTEEHLGLVSVRLLSLIGPPGVGKTRLAMAVAGGLLEDFPDGVWWVDLSSLQDPLLLGSEIAQAVRIAGLGAESSIDSLAAYFRDRQLLLVLDNFEQVLPAATWVGKLLERTTRMKILVTSRERLRLRWEKTLLVPPLPLPDLDHLVDPSFLIDIPSIHLFVQRAAAINPDFTFSAENAPSIAKICVHLDGLPLAIELAAARSSVLSPTEILTHMDNRFHLLGMSVADLPERQQTLQAAIDWSYALLQPMEKEFLRRLSIFAGGFSHTAAEMVGESEALGLDNLASLITLAEKSLISRAKGPGFETRFFLLESIREYLLDILQKNGELDRVRQRHAVYFLEFAEHYSQEIRKRDQKFWFDMLETENDNLRLALQWSADTGEYALGKRIAAAIWPFWWLHGHLREGARWLALFLGNDQEHDEAHFQLIEGAGMLQGWQGNYEQARSFFKQALANATERQNQVAMARVLGELGWILWINGKTDEMAWLEERLASVPSGADAWDLAYANLSLGCLQYEASQMLAAEKTLAKSLEYFAATDEKHGFTFAASKLALVKYERGDTQNARQEMREALKMARQAIDPHMLTICNYNALVLIAKLMMEQNNSDQQQAEKIAQALGSVDLLRDIFEIPGSPREMRVYVTIRDWLKRLLGEQTYVKAWQEGRTIPVEKVIDILFNLLHSYEHNQPGNRRLSSDEQVSHLLSEREVEVIGCVAEGLTNQEIAERLFISERTVRFHITSIFNKLGVNNRTQAVVNAVQRGLIKAT